MLSCCASGRGEERARWGGVKERGETEGCYARMQAWDSFPALPLPPFLFCRQEQELQDLAHQKWLYVQKHEETLAKVCAREGGMHGEKISGRGRGVAKVCVYEGGRQAGQ